MHVPKQPQNLREEKTEKMPSKITPTPPKYLQEEETLPQEFKTMIATLPRQKGWLASHLYRYDGYWYAARHLRGALNFQRHFAPQQNDVILATTPKSGTTWLKALIYTLTHRNIHPPSSESHPLTAHNPHDLVPFLEIKLFVDDQVPDLSSPSPSPSPRLFSTHIPFASLPEHVKSNNSHPHACKIKIVYLCRNPKDVFVSLWHFTNVLRPDGETKRFDSIDEAFDMFCQGVSLFGPYWDHVLGYWNRSREDPEGVLFLKYEDMKEKPGECLRTLASFLGCPLSEEEEGSGMADEILKVCSIDNLRALEVNKSGKLSSGEESKAFFRRGEVGDWKNSLSGEMVERIDRITEEKFGGSGLIV